MKLTVHEKIRKSKIRPDWDMIYWVVSIYDKKLIHCKYYNKMFDPLEVVIEKLKQIYPVTEIKLVTTHSFISYF
jgi:hypothetical protein